MGYSSKRIKEVAELKHTAVERIRTDIGQIDTSPSHKYIQEFTSEFSNFHEVCEMARVMEDAAAANLIWIGDYHALSRFQEFASTFLRDLYLRNRNIALALEPVFSRQQKTLDRWMSGKISEQAFLEAIHYDEEWGCDWKSYSLLFSTARELQIPVYGIDSHPRYDMRSIGRRDQRTARHIAGIIERDPARTLVIVFGESHLASRHLPARTRTILDEKGFPREELLILQNVDEIYWKLQKRGLENVQAVSLKDRQYCVFNATPIEKYESFRQYLHKCVDEDDTGVWTHFVHSLIDLTMEFVDLKRDTAIIDSLPKVYSEISPSDFPQILARMAVPAKRARMVLDHFQENGTSYVPELNSIFIHRLQLTAAAEESTRFIHQLCRGELPKSLDRPLEDQFFVSVLERALGYFCSKVLDSSRDGIESLSQRVLNQIGYEQLARAVSSLMNTARRPAAQHFETLKLAISAGSRASRTTHMLAQLLGYVLGRKLYGAFLDTRVSRRDIQALFCDPLDTPNRSLECYREWTERLS